MLSADKESHHYQTNVIVISRQGKLPLSAKCYQQTRKVTTIRQMLSAHKESFHYQVNAFSRQGKSPPSGKRYQQTRKVSTIRYMLSADKESHHYQANVISSEKCHHNQVNAFSRQGKSPQAGKCFQQTRQVTTIR